MLDIGPVRRSDWILDFRLIMHFAEKILTALTIDI